MKTVPTVRLADTADAVVLPDLPEGIRLAMTDIAGAAREGLLAMSVAAGMAVMQAMFEAEIAEVAGQRVTLGAFPWRWVGGEGCICRVAAFLDLEQPGIVGSTPPGSQPRQHDAHTTPARIMADGSEHVSY